MIARPTNLPSGIDVRRGMLVRPDYFPLLDLIRGLAAFFVVLEHARNYLWVDFPDLIRPSLVTKIIYFVSQFGHEAVLVFFVLSGCVVGRIAIQRCEAGRWQWRTYLFERISRLWIVLLPALLLTAIIDYVLVSWASAASFIHVGGFAHIQHAPIADRAGINEFLGNVFFLQTIVVPPFGSNGPLWSLANEFWYYLVFPALWVGIFGSYQWQARVFLFVCGLLVLWSTGPAIVTAFPIWLLGVVAYLVARNRNWSSSVMWSGLAVSTGFALAVLAGTRAGYFRAHGWGLWESPSIAISVAAMIVFGLNAQLPRGVLRVGNFLSSFSYSLYLVHLPLLTLMVAPFITDNHARMQPDAIGMATLFGSILVVYIITYGFYLITERNTALIRIWLTKFINPMAG